MTIKEAKENVIENFRRLNYPNAHEVEVFLLNTMEQLENLMTSCGSCDNKLSGYCPTCEKDWQS